MNFFLLWIQIKIIFFLGGRRGGGGGGRGARVNFFITMNPNLKKKKKYFL